MKKYIFKHESGYTLIELIIVVTIAIILMVTSMALFYTTMIGGGKTASQEEVKQAGQYALTQMSYLLYNSRKLVVNAENIICANGMVSLGIQNQDFRTTVFRGETVSNMVRIASNSGNYLTPANMTVSLGPTFSCQSNADGSPPTVSVSFTLQKGIVGTDRPRDIVSIPFQTSVTLRNN